VSILYDICCGNHLLQRQMITQAVNLLSWISSGKFTRELDKEPLLNWSLIYTKGLWSVLLIINPALMSMLPPHVHLKATMLYTCALTSSSRSFYYILGLMTSCHVTCHVTAISLKGTEIQKKRNIKSSKIDKRKRKMLMFKAFHNNITLF